MIIFQRVINNRNSYERLDTIEYINNSDLNLRHILGSWNANTNQLIGGRIYGCAGSLDLNTIYGKRLNIIFYSINEYNQIVLQFMYKNARYLTIEEQNHLKYEMKKSSILKERMDETYKSFKAIGKDISYNCLFNILNGNNYNIEVLPSDIISINQNLFISGY